MEDISEERLGYVFGLAGGLLLVVGGFLALAMGIIDLINGRMNPALAAFSEMALLLVIGGLAGFFAYLGRRSWKERPVTAGVLLVVMAALGWASLGLGTNLFALIGAIFVFLGGVLYLIPPTTRALHRPASA